VNVTVDADRCRGHGVCCTICPEVFTLNDDGYTVVQLAEVPAAFQDEVGKAAASCPERAIAVTH
jgi:ferredoxin